MIVIVIVTAAIAVAVAVTVAVAVAVAVVVTIVVAIGVIIVASRTEIMLIAVVLIPHHRRHHDLHLGTHSGLSRLKICFTTLQTVGNISESVNGSGLDTWSRLNRWRSFGLFAA